MVTFFRLLRSEVGPHTKGHCSLALLGHTVGELLFALGAGAFFLAWIWAGVCLPRRNDVALLSLGWNLTRGRSQKKSATATVVVQHLARLCRKSQCCQALPFKLRIVGPLFADFSMILRILSQYFLKRKRERKTTRRKRNDETYTRKRCRHNPAFSLLKKCYWNRRSSRQNCFTVTCETERWRGPLVTRKGKLCTGRYSRYHCFIVHHFAGTTVVCGCSKIHHWPTPSDVDRFARFSWDLAFTWREMSIKPRWSMLKSAQRKANAKGTQHASLFYDELPVGKAPRWKDIIAAFFAFFCLSVLHTLRLYRTWSLIMMQTGQNYC